LRDLHDLRRGVVLAADLVVLTSRPGKPAKPLGKCRKSWGKMKTGIYPLKIGNFTAVSSGYNDSMVV
jgi:hypothetical protein